MDELRAGESADRLTERMWQAPRLAVIIPTFNERGNIELLYDNLSQVLADTPWEMIVVDDNSPDGTADVAEKAGRDLGGDSVHVLRRAGREGLGRAYRAGWSWCLDAGYEVIVSMDADGSHDPATLPALLDAVEAGADVAMGSRYVPGGSVPGWSWHRRLLSRSGGMYAAAVLRLPIHDATGGYRAYRADLLRRIDLTSLHASGYGFQIEMIHRANQLRATIVEIPIRFVDRRLGTSKMRARIIWEALGLVTWWGLHDRVLHRGKP